MMRFNGSCLEVPTTGEPAGHPSFEAGVQTSGLFIARIKRAGKRSKQLGWTELFLLDNNKLALCSDSSTDSDSDSAERFLLFPVFEGTVFRQIKRHGHALTLMAPSYSIVLEAEAGDDRASTQASKWGRILQRLSAAEHSRSTAYFKGLGITLNTFSSKPQRTKQGLKQLVPSTHSNQDASRDDSQRSEPVPVHEATSAPVPVPAPMAHKPLQTSAPRAAEPSQTQFATRQYAGFQPTGIPRSASGQSSKSAKRLSLGLGKTGAVALDLGFGEDLKGILGVLEPGAAVPEEADEENELRVEGASKAKKAPIEANIPGEETNKAPRAINAPASAPTSAPPTAPSSVSTGQNLHIPKTKNSQHEPLAAPMKPFSEGSSLTPSPNSLYLQNASPSESSLLSATSNKELNRMESILVKEQQQQLDRYGSRAAAMSSFDLSLPPRPLTISASTSSSSPTTAESPSSSNPPPAIPPPVPDSQPIRIAKRVSIAQTSPSVQYIPRDDSGCESESDEEIETATGGLPSPRSEHRQHTATQRKKNPGIVKAVKKFWNKRRVPKEPYREFKGPMELLREQEAAERQQYELPRTKTPPLVDEDDEDAMKVKTEAQTDSRPQSMKMSRSTAASEWRALAMVQEESETEATPRLPSPPVEEPPRVETAQGDDSVAPVAQAVAPVASPHATSAVPKMDSQTSISALSFRSMRSQPSLSSAVLSDDCLGHHNDHNIPGSADSGQPKPATIPTPEAPKVEVPNTVARLDPKQDASWQQIVEQHTKPSVAATQPEPKPAPKPAVVVAAASKPAAVVPTASLDPGRFTTTDRTTNPIIRKVFESGNNKSTPALVKPPPEGLHSASSSYSSFGSFKRSAPSYGSQASSLSSIAYSNSASSLSAPSLVTPQKGANSLEVTLLSTNLWVSKWAGAKWTPLSQLELRTEIVATSAGVRVLVMNPGGVGCIPLQFSPQCELRRVSAHDTELKTVDNTYMFRGRDAENSQKFYRTLAALQTDGVASTSVPPPVSSLTEHTRDDTFDNRRRTLVPPVLSRSSYAPKYMGMSTSTIVEE